MLVEIQRVATKLNCQPVVLELNRQVAALCIGAEPLAFVNCSLTMFVVALVEPVESAS